MKQDPNNQAKFTLASGEAVTVVVAAIKTSCRTAASFNGTEVDPNPEDPDTYTFVVTGNPGDEFLFNCECHFDSTAPADAVYTVVVSSSGGGRFTISDIPNVPAASFILYFTVVKPSA